MVRSMNKKYDLVIFDLDGTLADTSPGILNCVRYVQQKLDLPEISLEKMYSHVGPPMEESYHKNFGLTGEKLKRAVELHKEYAVTNGYRELTVYDGIYDLLKMLRAKGIKTAVATLKAQTTTEKIFAEYNLTELFDVIAGTDSSAPKTKAQLIEDCLALTGVEKNNAVLIGDSSYDAIGAEQAGVDFIAVTYGFGFKTEDDVSTHPHIAVCGSVKELSNSLIGIWLYMKN